MRPLGPAVDTVFVEHWQQDLSQARRRRWSL
jgi:hypothetical protein